MAPELKSYGGAGQYLSSYLLGICVPYCPVICNALIRTSCPSPFRPGHQRSAAMVTEDLGFSGAVFPIWTPPPSPMGAPGVHLGTSGPPLSLLVPLALNHSWRGSASSFPQPSLWGVHPEMKEQPENRTGFI